jgi:DNA-directed RNA polymerase subunit RPC12/RpoP
MISFDCHKCGKALIVPSAKSGGVVACPSCGEGLLVPAPRQPSKLGLRLKLLFFVLAVLAGGWLTYSWAYTKYLRAGVVQDRLYANLQDLSPQWRGPSWEKCDPRIGEYKVTVFYLRDAGRYVFEASAFTAFDQAFVVVNPSRNAAEWLARAAFSHGEQESYRYAGDNEDERRDLNILTHDLADALREAIR